ncbi:hypothetical protein tb265_27010 [Gemmatimonadetes bacterium T265]|nr:hypothetical protein tb265_27010 [Gemmatimonadetes bacterium T265]
MTSRTARIRVLAAFAAPLAARALAAQAGSPPAPSTMSGTTDPPPTYTERYRPQYHFTPAANWMNDPNGLVYYDGEWHLFYQHNPFGNRHGHISWGHAVSTDLVHWQNLPVAIPHTGAEGVWSGSAVVDWQNTSGFGQGGKPPMVAIYTGFDEAAKRQAQHIAYSTDRGRTWTRYAGNPVLTLDLGLPDFRDPKVFWHAPTGRWVMVVSLPTEHKVRFYGSPNLKQWSLLGDFGPAGATGGVWECPDLFEVPVDGDPRHTRWVLVVNVNPGGIAGGSATQYFVGRFDGNRFAADEPSPRTANPGAPTVRWADYGKDLYATVSWSDVPRADGRRVWIGWMSNWQYAFEIPTSPWRSAMSVPRTVALTTTRDGLRLVQQPVVELERLRGERRHVGPQTIPVGSTSLAARGVTGKSMEIAATFEVNSAEPGRASEFGLKVRTGNGEETVIGIDPKARQLIVDRTRSGQVGFHADFPSREAAPLPVEDGRVRLRVLVDWSSVEVFAGDGRVVVTDQIFPAPESEGVQLYAKGGTARLVSLDAWPLASARTTAAAAPQRAATPGR